MLYATLKIIGELFKSNSDNEAESSPTIKVTKEELFSKYDEVNSFEDGMAAVMKNGSWGYVDHNGALAVNLEYLSVKSFKYGLALVITKQKWGVIIDKKGNWLTESFPMTALHTQSDKAMYNELYFYQDICFGYGGGNVYGLNYTTPSPFYNDDDTITRIECDTTKKYFTIKKNYGKPEDITNYRYPKRPSY